jgi:hypothetical protein
MKRAIAIAATILAAVGLSLAFAFPAHAFDGSIAHFYISSYDWNAWNGGPTVAAYDGSSNQDDFFIESDPDNSSYVNLYYGYSGTYSGYCIGDTGNNQNNYSASLSGANGSCSNGSPPWGGNFTIVTAGCAPGTMAFKDAHTGMYLAFQNYANGSQITLDGSQLCFHQTDGG